MNRLIKLCFLVAIFAVCSEKEEEPEVLEVVNISNTPGRSEFPAIAADSRGYFYVVWEERAPNGIMAVYMTQRPPGGNWTTPNYIINPQTPMRQPDIAIDKENTIHVVGQYTNPQGWAEVFYTKKPLGGNWSELEIIGMYGMAAVPKIAVDNYGNVHIVWQELVGYWPIIYSKRSKDGSWSIPVEVSKELGEGDYTLHPKIVADPKGYYAHIVWTQCVNLEDVLVYTTNAPTGTWGEPTVVCRDPELKLGISPQLVIDDNQTVHFVWKMKSDIFYSFKRMDNQFGTPVRVCSTSTVSASPYLAVENNILHLIWVEDERKIYYTCKNGYNNDWAAPKIYLINTIGDVFDAKFAISLNNIGLIFDGFILPATGEDNYEIFFGEIPKIEGSVK